MSEDWHNPNRPKLKNIKDEDVAYELRELSKYTSLTPEIINIICHGYARICQLERERDEARRENEQLKRYAHYCRPQSGSNHKLRSNIDRTDLPSDVIDDIRYAYGEIMRIYKLLDDQTESTQKALQKRDDD